MIFALLKAGSSLTGKKLAAWRKAERKRQRERQKEIEDLIKRGCSCEYGSAAGPSTTTDPYCRLHGYGRGDY